MPIVSKRTKSPLTLPLAGFCLACEGLFYFTEKSPAHRLLAANLARQWPRLLRNRLICRPFTSADVLGDISTLPTPVRVMSLPKTVKWAI